MTNAERIVAALRARGALTDGELRRLTGVEPHQQVNQICRRLEAQGILRRTRGRDGRIVNILVDEADLGTSVASTRPAKTHAQPSPSPVTTSSPPPVTTTSPLDGRPRSGRCLFIIPCSASKASGGQPGLARYSVTDLLPDHLADRLVQARAALRSRSRLDESRLLPAWQRYTGTLHATARDAIRQAMADGSRIVILSGGYGLLLADEPIGIYDRKFALPDWPHGLLEDCLVALGKGLGVERVLAFCARSTGYAELVRRARWQQAGLEAALASPDMGGRGGAQVLVPRAAGEALSEALYGRLASGWHSTDGVEIRTQVLA